VFTGCQFVYIFKAQNITLILKLGFPNKKKSRPIGDNVALRPGCHPKGKSI